jgi:DMSO/TMAO reductase YedYZ molybdopterin-dependent catalytic subunit
MLNPKQRRLYQRGYAGLLTQITRLVQLAQAPDSNMAALVLYGSTSRLEPHKDSDADLLVLLCDWERRSQAGAIVVEASSVYDVWPFSPLRTDLQASNLPEELLEQIARDGVLLYLRPGVQLPAPLQSIRPYEQWRREVERLVQQPVSA